MNPFSLLLNSLVDEVNHKIVTDKGLEPTSSTILGPFWSPETPFRDLGASVIQDLPKDGQVTFFHGVVKDVDTGLGIPDATFDMWQASTNGKYDVFDPENQTRHNLRGKFKTNEKGEFWFYCLKPTEYAIDTSGPSAELLRLMGRHPNRPAHIHAMVRSRDSLLQARGTRGNSGTVTNHFFFFFLADDCRLPTLITLASRPSCIPTTTHTSRRTSRVQSSRTCCWTSSPRPETTRPRSMSSTTCGCCRGSTSQTPRC